MTKSLHSVIGGADLFNLRHFSGTHVHPPAAQAPLPRVRGPIFPAIPPSRAYCKAMSKFSAWPVLSFLASPLTLLPPCGLRCMCSSWTPLIHWVPFGCYFSNEGLCPPSSLVDLNCGLPPPPEGSTNPKVWTDLQQWEYKPEVFPCQTAKTPLRQSPPVKNPKNKTCPPSMKMIMEQYYPCLPTAQTGNWLQPKTLSWLATKMLQTRKIVEKT